MNILIVIPARLGSKRLPRKNLLRIANRSILSYTLEHIAINIRWQLASDTDIVVATESDEIARLARSMGCDTVAIPPQLTEDDCPTNPVIIRAVDGMELRYRKTYDLVVEMYISTPVRPANCLNDCVHKLLTTDAGAVMAMESDSRLHADYLLNLNECGEVIQSPIRVIIPPYRISGAAFVIRRALLKDPILGPNGDPYRVAAGGCIGVVYPNGTTVDIDTEQDLNYAEFLIKKQQCL